MTLKVANFHGSLEPKLAEIWKNKLHVSDTKIIQTTRKSSYFAFIRPKNRIFIHFQAEVFENVILKQIYQWSAGFEMFQKCLK